VISAEGKEMSNQQIPRTKLEDLRDLAKEQVGVTERARETKTAEQLAGMIREDLIKVDGCPERGVNVTVYGIPWRAMLKFGAEAGSVRNRAELQQFFTIITERLQRLYDVE
jgi:hypothetical protein